MKYIGLLFPVEIAIDFMYLLLLFLDISDGYIVRGLNFSLSLGGE
jgi:hypothetical protein